MAFDLAGTRRARWAPALIFGVLAYAAVLEITDPPAPGLDPDAASYLGAAESMVAGRGIAVPSAHWWSADSTQPLTHFPPGFSAAIALPTALGMGPVQASRLVNALAAFVTMTTIVLLVIDASSMLTGVFAGSAILAMSSMHEGHVSVLSEPLFLTFAALALAGMVRRPTSPLASGVPAAFGFLVRYAGVALVAAVGVWSAAQRGSIPIRIRRMVTSVLPAVLLQGSWVLWRRHVAPRETIRTLALYGDVRTTLRQGAQTVKAWLVPDPGLWNYPVRLRGLVAAATLLVVSSVVGKGVHAMRRHGHGPPAGESAVAARARRLLGAGSLLISAYIGVILVSRVVADPLIPFDQRLLSPVFLLATILVAVCVFHWWHSTASTLPKIALTGALLGWWAATALVTLRQQRRIQRFGADIDAPRWARSELIEFAGTDGASHQLYTNQPAAVYFHLHRPARDVPALGDSDRMEEFADSVRAHDGRVLMFNPSRGPSRRIDVLRRVPGLRTVLDGPSGTAFAAVPRAATPALPPTAVRPSPPR